MVVLKTGSLFFFNMNTAQGFGWIIQSYFKNGGSHSAQSWSSDSPGLLYQTVNTSVEQTNNVYFYLQRS
jgi:hypothetical protein